MATRSIFYQRTAINCRVLLHVYPSFYHKTPLVSAWAPYHQAVTIVCTNIRVAGNVRHTETPGTATEMRESSSTVFLPFRPSNTQGVRCLFPSVLQRCNFGCSRLSASATFAFLSLPFNSFLLSLFFCYFLTVYIYLLVSLISLPILRCSFTLSTRPFSTGCVLAAVRLQASTGPWLYPYEYPGTHF